MHGFDEFLGIKELGEGRNPVFAYIMNAEMNAESYMIHI